MPVEESVASSHFDEAQAGRLAEVYAPCFALILQLRASHEYGDAEVLRRRVKDLFDRSEREALRTGYNAEDLRLVKFALVAFIDETLLSSNWSQKAYWVAKPMQLELYDRYDAGEVFFVRLDELRSASSRAEVLEVYYLCMTLGFKGQYQLHDQERLHILIDEVYAILSRTAGMGSGMLAPHGKPRDQIATEVRNALPVWVVALFAVVIALIVYIGMSLYMSSKADSTVEAIDQIPRAEASR